MVLAFSAKFRPVRRIRRNLDEMSFYDQMSLATKRRIDEMSPSTRRGIDEM